MPQRTIFISYTKTDEGWAKMIGRVLEDELGHKVIAMYKGLPGDWRDRIVEGLKTSDDIILVASPLYEKRPECQFEINLALKLEYSEKREHVHVIKVAPYNVGLKISVLSFIDLLYPLNSPEAITYCKNEIEKWWGSVSKKPPTHHNLPSRIPNFTGRNGEIETLHKDFFSGEPEKRIQVLSGLGGVGKTKVSLEYAFKNLDYYTLIWFFHAEDPTQLKQEITRLVQILELPEAQSENFDQHLIALKNGSSPDLG